MKRYSRFTIRLIAVVLVSQMNFSTILIGSLEFVGL